ncbi:fimbrial protein [Dysgonomonas sp. ZJ709]|uniref:fimbrial protein n=1 Tax=Dysgonomonas sp. ZJ709 TaxID=2709797 RepID=UPI0013EA9264|nr:fimbrial protein [Dysgonomonas sp. ZJ709]
MRIFSQHTKTYILQLSLFVIAGLFYGCSDETITNKNNGNGAETYIQFGVMTTNATPPKSLVKSGQTDSESTINEIQILVFENDNYLYRVDGTNIINSGTYSATFKARLLSSDEPTTIYIVANADAEINTNEPQAGESKAAVKARLSKIISASPISGNLSMWGTYEFPSGLSATTENTINNIRMLRSVARVDVIVNSAVTNFELVSIQAFRVANNMQIIPNDPTTTPSVTDPSVPTGTSYTINTDPILTAATTSSVSELYLPESPTPSSGNLVNDATCIVIGGRYEGETVSYYRLDFNPNTAGNPLGQILRNTRYEFNITSVARSGYATALEAANNISSSMDTRIVLWQDYIKHVVFDINNYLGVSESYIRLPGEAGSSYDILTETDLSTYTLTWADVEGNPSGDPSSTGLDDGHFQIIRSSDGSTISITAIEENSADDDDDVVRFVLVRGGALELLITIIQKTVDPTPEPGPGGVVWAETNVDLPYTFADQTQIGKFYQWNRNVAWASTGEVTGWDTTGAIGTDWSTSPCPDGWRIPTRAELQALLDSEGRDWRIVSDQYNYPGVWFAPTQAEAVAATFENPGNALFFPAGGTRNTTGGLESAGSNSHYWASDVNPLGDVTEILSIANGTYLIFPINRASGALVRCVHDL